MLRVFATLDTRLNVKHSLHKCKQMLMDKCKQMLNTLSTP